MSSRTNLVAAIAAIGLPLAMLAGGCTMCKATSVEVASTPVHVEPAPEKPMVVPVADLLPPNAKPGECYVRVYVPAQFATTKETIKVRDASERLEIVPARHEWVEEQVLVKDASTVLEEVPAEFKVEERQILVDAGHTGWQVERTAKCLEQVPQQKPAEEMFCLVSHKPIYETVTANVMVKPATTRSVTIPAEYQTVRRQKLVAPATTRRIPIPEEYATVEQTRKVADAHVEWRRVDCEPQRQADAGTPQQETQTSLVSAPADK